MFLLFLFQKNLIQKVFESETCIEKKKPIPNSRRQDSEAVAVKGHGSMTSWC